MEYEIIANQDGFIAKVGFKFYDIKVYNIRPLLELRNGGVYPKGWYAKPKQSENPWFEYRGPDEDYRPINNEYEYLLVWQGTPFVACKIS